MTEGPPPSEATSSKASPSVISNLQKAYTTPWYTTSYAQYNPQPAAGNSSIPPNPTTPGLYQPYPQTSNPYAAHYGPHAYYPQYQSQPASYISQPPTPTSSSFNLKPMRKAPSPSPSPPLPDPETYKHWDLVIRAFFIKTGLTQTLKGFEDDMLVFNPEWERLKIPLALEAMIKGLTAASENKETGEGHMEDAMQVDIPSEPTANSTQSKSEVSTESLETRKLSYIRLANGAQPRSPSSINKSISLFLAKNQARNDASNRAEFLSSLAERRKPKRVEEDGDSAHFTNIDSSDALDSDIGGMTCARADAKAIDRDAQMKYDIAKDDYGPLSRSAKAGLLSENGKMKSSPLEAEGKGTKPKTTKREIDDEVPSTRYPGLDERLKNIEDHIAVRFVPNPPRTLLARLKFLEDHLVKLEKEYPPWAALHFNQPGRGWPPPPRTTPIIVPIHLRDTGSTPVDTTPIDPPAGKTKPTKTKNKKAKSSLHRAVMERLEVQKAMNDLT